MHFIAFFVLLTAGLAVNSEKHSLTYVYTALSKPVDLPGIHEFTAAGLLDSRMIDYYDNDIKKKVPKQRWMMEKLDAEYWKNGTESCLSKQQELKSTINKLKTQMNQNDDLHDLQLMASCQVEKLPDGNIKFLSAKYVYKYDGENFLSFDVSSKFWVPFTKDAEQTRRKWDHDEYRNNLIINYLQNECVDLLTKFISYEQNELKNTQPPTVFLLSKQAKVQANVILTCLATGFYPKDITLEIIRNDRVVQQADGLMSSGVRPNHDDTYQRRDSVEVSKTDVSIFKCVFTHKATGVHIVRDPVSPEGNTGVIVGVVGGLIVLMLVVGVALLLVLYKRGIIDSDLPVGQNSIQSIKPSVRSIGSSTTMNRTNSCPVLGSDLPVGQNSNQVEPLLQSNGIKKEAIKPSVRDIGISTTSLERAVGGNNSNLPVGQNSIQVKPVQLNGIKMEVIRTNSCPVLASDPGGQNSVQADGSDERLLSNRTETETTAV